MTKKTSVTIQNLPDYVLSYLLTYTEKKDGVHFASMNISLHHRMMKHFVRSMTFGFDEAIQLVHDELHAKKVLDKVHNPYRQLSCFLPAEWKPSINSISTLYSLKVLECSYDVFNYTFLHSLDKIQQLTLFPNEWSNNRHNTDDDDSVENINNSIKPLTNEGILHLLNQLSLKNRDDESSTTNLQLKHLLLDGYTLPDLSSYIPSLQSLELMNSSTLTSIHPYYSNLHKLVLRNISSISNLQLLNNIYDLSLYSCNNIKDITCLNNNHTIIIYDCQSILDYSHSFANSTSVEIIDANEDAIIEFSSKMMKLESFTVSTSKQVMRPILTNGCNPRSLQKLTIQGYPEYTHTHPKIRCLKIERCNDITIETALDNLQVLTLTHCDISSLKGLVSASTRVVTLDHCNAIKDFSYLRHVSKVSILDCAGFENVEEVDHVRHLVLRAFDKEMRLGSLGLLGEHVEHLELRGKIEIEGDGLIGLENVPVIEIASFDLIESTRLEGLGNNQKLVLSITNEECFEDIDEILEDMSEMNDYSLTHTSSLQVILKKRIGGLCM